MDNKTLVDKVIEKYQGDSREVLEILLDIQGEKRYLPKEALNYVAEKLDIPVTRLYRIAKFYEALSLKPMGECQVHVCTGTACHVRGASRILDELEHQLGIDPGEVTEDQSFGLKTVNCVGACALGPVVVVNGEHYGNMSALKVGKLVKEYSKEQKDKEKKQA
ncbi:NADH-quinone oxidoreductase subunit NuoE family protein [Candidatus Contubernalis alkaliaceticus]|uniref:NADH-quinone oxidoreductase subunit NuoE family protein n=1 Tax=Candidatus Contubernalis alkaliaceticus TaxID=338645 RepID=UPI001F4BE538|nr:NAD(P)H-dependent oxidoreductase subunit E [Candidatus Contubernalis alkalaceticus]UNC91377.1 NAD(P)H-dependent oxidoreductase subunit E [Candidatus Contubernalis alkalaceticus]